MIKTTVYRPELIAFDRAEVTNEDADEPSSYTAFEFIDIAIDMRLRYLFTNRISFFKDGASIAPPVALKSMMQACQAPKN